MSLMNLSLSCLRYKAIVTKPFITIHTEKLIVAVMILTNIEGRFSLGFVYHKFHGKMFSTRSVFMPLLIMIKAQINFFGYTIR